MASYNSNSKLAQPEKQLPQGQWSTGLFDCLDDRSNCTNFPPMDNKFFFFFFFSFGFFVIDISSSCFIFLKVFSLASVHASPLGGLRRLFTGGLHVINYIFF